MKAFRCAFEFALALLAAAVGIGAASAAACDAAGRLNRADLSRIEQLSGPSGASRTPIAAFADGDLLFVVFERMSAIVVPPTLSGAYAGLQTSDGHATVMLRRQRNSAPLQSQAPRLRDSPAAKVLAVGRSDEFHVLPRGDHKYVVVPGAQGTRSGACIGDGVSLLPSRDADVLRLPVSATIRNLDGEIAVESGASTLLLTACCDFDQLRPEDSDLDPRLLADRDRFSRHVAAERFSVAPLAVDWTAGARAAHEVLMQGRAQEAGQVLTRLRANAAAEAAPAIAMLADLAALVAPQSVAPFPATPSSVRESRARMALAREILAACRTGELDAIGDRQIDFAEILPNLRSLPAEIATRLVLCEARRLALRGDVRAALTRLRAPDRPERIEDDPHWLALDAWLLLRAGQEELATFRRTKLQELLLENGEALDMRAIERFVTPVELLGASFALRYLVERVGSFGDRRIDTIALASSLRTLRATEIAPFIGRLSAWRRTVAEPALAARIDRVIGARLVSASDPEFAGTLLDAYELTRVLAAAPHLADISQDLRLAAAEFAAAAGLDAEARASIGSFMANAGASDAGRLPRFKASLDRYLALRRIMDEKAIAGDAVWSLPSSDVAVRAALAESRAAVLAGLVGDVLLGQGRSAGPDLPELGLLERLRRLGAAP